MRVVRELGVFIIVVHRGKLLSWAHGILPVGAAFSIRPVGAVLSGEPVQLGAYLAQVWSRAVCVSLACGLVGVPVLLGTGNKPPWLRW